MSWGSRGENGEELLCSWLYQQSYQRLYFIFYRFPVESNRRRLWIAAINRKGWEPIQYSFVRSAHISGKKSNDHLSHLDTTKLKARIKNGGFSKEETCKLGKS